MSSRHETSSARHGCSECSRMHSNENGCLDVAPPEHSEHVLNQCHSTVSFQDMIISGLQPETSYSLTVTAYTTKGDGARSKPKLVSTTGAGNHICAYVYLGHALGDSNTNFPNGMGGVSERGKKRLWSTTFVYVCVCVHIIIYILFIEQVFLEHVLIMSGTIPIAGHTSISKTNSALLRFIF